MARKIKAKPNAKTETRATSTAVDDRHLSHPHAEPVDPAGGAVFEKETAVKVVSKNPSAETPTAAGGADAIGFALLGEACTESDDDDGNGVGALVRDDCDPTSATETATAASQPVRVTIARAATPSGVSASTGKGFAVLPDGRVAGADGDNDGIREGFGLVISE